MINSKSLKELKDLQGETINTNWTDEEKADLLLCIREGLIARTIHTANLFPKRTFLSIEAQLRRLRTNEEKNNSRA